VVVVVTAVGTVGAGSVDGGVGSIGSAETPKVVIFTARWASG
jgi:hypothetical protein